MNATPAHITAWAAYKQAEGRGDLVAAERSYREWLDLLSGSIRNDAAPPMTGSQEQKPAPAPSDAGGGIDWSNVASEVGIMLALNPQAGSDQEEEQEEPA